MSNTIDDLKSSKLPKYEVNLETKFVIIGDLETQNNISKEVLDEYNKKRIGDLVNYLGKFGTRFNRIEKRIKIAMHKLKDSNSSTSIAPFAVIDYVLIEDKYNMYIQISGTELWQPEIVTIKSNKDKLLSYYRLTSVGFEIKYGCEDFKITDCAVYINDVEDKLTEFYSRRSLLDKLNSEKLLKEIGFNKK
jgi:hypothetical protein